MSLFCFSWRFITCILNFMSLSSCWVLACFGLCYCLLSFGIFSVCLNSLLSTYTDVQYDANLRLFYITLFLDIFISLMCITFVEAIIPHTHFKQDTTISYQMKLLSCRYLEAIEFRLTLWSNYLSTSARIKTDGQVIRCIKHKDVLFNVNIGFEEYTLT